MAVRARGGLFADDEELGKKDDDRKINSSNWTGRTKSPWWRKRRIAGILLGCVVVYLFIANLPTEAGDYAKKLRVQRPTYTSQKSNGRAIPKSEYNFDKEDVYPQELHDEDSRSAKTPARIVSTSSSPDEKTKDFSYDGPVRFYYLAASLHNIKNIIDFRPGNRHVLFAASDLSSAASLIPIACEMAGWKRNTVHFAIFGREKVTIADIMEVNGAMGAACPIYWHDARPDRGEDSTGPRMQLSVSGAMSHIVSFMHPQVVITTDEEHENVYFTTGMSRSVKAMALTQIEVPKTAPEKLAWLARLDAGSLNSWHSAGVDILVQAPLESSGSLIRLLHSLEKADYAGFHPPRLTIELPHKIDQATQNFLTQFRWPPYQYLQNPTQPDELITRRRISEQHVNSDEASLRFVESFYPSSPKGPHVLLLSPQAELSPVYFHYLKLHLLEYRHSLEHTDHYRNLLGISLETPTMYLNGTTKFVPPVSADDTQDDGTYNPFRWQAPDSNAALYFSDKWIEFHSFLTKRRTASLHPRTGDHHASRSKQVSQKQPAWVEYALDIMRARGYSLHYPGLFSHFKGHADNPSQSLVIIHNELYQAPEEFTRPSSNLHKRAEVEDEEDTPLPDSILSVSADAADYLPAHHPAADQSQEINEERPLLRALMHMLPPLELSQVKDTATGQPELRPRTLPLPDLARLPLLDWSGEELQNTEMQRRARNIRIGYRHLAGGCSDKAANVDDMQPGSAEDLFCLDDDDVADVRKLTSSKGPARPLAQALTTHGEAAKPVVEAANKIVDTAKKAAAAGVGAAAAALHHDSDNDNDQTRAARPVLDADSAADAVPTTDKSVPLKPAHKSFEDEMAQREAAKVDRMNDRARSQGDKQAAVVNQMRKATEGEDELVAGTATRPRAGKIGKIRVADENDDEEASARAPVAADTAGDVELDDRDVTKTHIGPGDPNAPIPKLRATGAAAHVNAADNPAAYAETARAGFTKKTGGTKAQATHANEQAHVTHATPAESPTKTNIGPGDPNAPVPSLRATGVAAHVNAAEDPAKYAETARAKFLNKMDKKIGKGKLNLAPGSGDDV